MKKPLLLFIGVALLYAGPGLLPGRRLVPADIPRDFLAWKGDPSIRVRVSNSLLSDVPLQLIPWDTEASRLLARGEMPWMNRYAGVSEQLFANPSAGLLSPFAWPRLLFGLRGWTWTVLLKIVVAALSAYWLARALGADRDAATLSGAIYALSGFAIVWALYPQTNVFVLLPALAAAGVERRTVAVALLAALATVSGHPETLAVGVMAIFALLIATRQGVRHFAAAALAGFLLAGIHLVPFAFALRDSHAIHTRTDQLQVRFRALGALSAVFPGALGSPLRDEIDLTGPIAFAENFNQRTGAFIGGLALLAVLIAGKRRALALAFLALSLAIPGLAHIQKLVPVLKWVAFEYFQAGFVLLASAAAGVALLSIARGAARTRLAKVILSCGAMVLIAGVMPAIAPRMVESAARSWIALLQKRHYLNQPMAVYEQRLSFYVTALRVTAIRRVALPALCWIAGGIALAMRPSRRREILLSTAAVAELAIFGIGYNPSIGVREIAREPAPIAEVKRRDPQQQWLTASSSAVFPPNLGTTFGVRQSHAYDILVSEREVRTLLPAGYGAAHWDLPAEPSAEQSRVLAARGVRFYLTPRGLIELPNPQPPPPMRNDPPAGLLTGAGVSAAGAMLLIALLPLDRRWRL